MPRRDALVVLCGGLGIVVTAAVWTLVKPYLLPETVEDEHLGDGDLKPAGDLEDRVLDAIVVTSGFPKPDSTYVDATACVTRSGLRDDVTSWLKTACGVHFDIVVGLEARGMLVGNAVASSAGVDFVPVRLKSRTPASNSSLCVQVASVSSYRSKQVLSLTGSVQSQKILLVDDVVSSGASLQALVDLVEQAGGTVVGATAIVKVGPSLPSLTIPFKILTTFKQKDGPSPQPTSTLHL